jgi:hypothetical protein
VAMTATVSNPIERNTIVVMTAPMARIPQTTH